MGRSPCCSKKGLNRGAWTAMEDTILTDFIRLHGEGKWRNLPGRAGLKRCGKSCRLRWLNYLRPDIKRGNITPDEEDLIIRLHNLLGNRWSLIAGRLPGRTDNEIKNYWNTNIGKRVRNRNDNASPKTMCRTKTSNPGDNKVSPEPSPRHSLPSPASTVVRTRATRCTKVILSPPVPHVPAAAPLADDCQDAGEPLTVPSTSDENFLNLDCLQYFSNCFSDINMDFNLGFDEVGKPDRVVDDALGTAEDLIFSEDMFCSPIDPQLDWLPQYLEN